MADQPELQLSIQTINFTPATVEFNADQIRAVLDQQLTKYKGLTFSEEDEAAAKKVIAELRKGKSLLETYRKETKAKLTASVTDFEAEIKSLAAQFDAVIQPLTEQTAAFEANRRDKKRDEIDQLWTALLLEYELRSQFAAQLTIPDEYLNRSTSMKTITLELRAAADKLRSDQDRQESELAMIRGSVGMANQYLPGEGLLEATYTNMLGQLTLQQVLDRIADDAAQIKARAERRAAEAKAAEERAAAPPSAPPSPAPAPSPPAASLPPVATPSSSTGAERYVETYTVHGTEAQLEALEAFLEKYSYEWHIRD